MLELFDNIKTSYEKMGIDKIIYTLGKFYKENLENINIEILSCVNKFKEVGITLFPADFDYSIYVNEYMNTFFGDINNVNSDNVKEKFEEIYWKCPDIIIHIELNFRYLYLKNKKTIDKYYEKRKEEVVKRLNIEPEKIKERYEETIKKKDEIESVDKYIITQKFLQGELDAKNYTEDKVKGEYLKLISADVFNKAKPKQLKEIEQSCMKFLYSLYEYKNFLKYKFIYDDIKKKYQEKEQYKNKYNSTKKEINNKEKKLQSLNKKINAKGLFGKNSKKEQQTAEYNQTVLEIKGLYKELDNAEIYEKINTNLTDNSSIYDVLLFASRFNNYLVDCIVSVNNAITQEEIDKFIEELKEFLINPYNVIIKNITIVEEKDIPMIISDRYKLLNFMITKDDITESNLDTLISTLQVIKNNYDISRSQIKIEDMQFISDAKKIINKK